MLTIGLVNTYDKIKIHEIHYRSIARAAPVAFAWDFSLALFDYPFKLKPKELIEAVISKTTIGYSGAYLKELYEKNRFFMSHLPKKGFMPQFGHVVATTSHPENHKKISLNLLKEMIRDKNSFIFLIGLGHKGLPLRVMTSLSEYHLDITSKGISLETCTAIGCIALVCCSDL